MKAFEKGKIGGIEVKNRIFRSATWEGSADKGKVSDSLVKMYKNLAKGDVGLIITGYVVFSETDHYFPATVQIVEDGAIFELKNWQTRFMSWAQS